MIMMTVLSAAAVAVIMTGLVVMLLDGGDPQGRAVEKFDFNRAKEQELRSRPWEQ